MTKTSQIVAKALIRLFFLLLLVAAIPLFQGDNSKLSQLYFVVPNKWVWAFPSLLVIGFIILFISCTINKYKDVTMNWLLVVNTAVLLVCSMVIYFRVLALLK